MENSTDINLLKQLNDHLRLLIAWQQSHNEDIQRNISLQIHNELGQEITGLKMDIAWLKRKTSNNQDPIGMQEKLREMNDLIDKMVNAIRRIELDLYPSILDNLGIEAALEWQGHEIEMKHGISVQFFPSVGELKPAYPVANGLYRIYKEALTTISENGEAKNIRTVFDLQNDLLRLVITDDGKPVFSCANGIMNRVELLAIKERTTMINGQLQISHDHSLNNMISISIPSKYIC